MIKKTIFLIITITLSCCLQTNAQDNCAELVEAAKQHMVNQHYSRVIELMDSCLKNDPSNAEASNLKGCAFIRVSYINDEKNNKTDVTCFTKAIQTDSGNYMYYNNRGWAYANLDDYTKANTDYKKAVQLDSTNIELQQNLLRVMIVRNRNKEALAFSNKLITQFPNDGYAYYIRGNLKRDYLHKYPEGNKDIKISEQLNWRQGMYLMY